jgi:hypothetical protein
MLEEDPIAWDEIADRVDAASVHTMEHNWLGLPESRR